MNAFGCINNTIKVASGHYIDLRDPQPSQIDIQSVAAGLSKICRFAGQCPEFYSVAEHSILAYRLACWRGIPNEALKAVLLHDAGEAYIGDMVKPLKIMLPEYQVVESRMEAAIEARFGVEFAAWRDVIKRFDRAMLKAEKQTLWPDDSEEWTGFSEIEAAEVDIKFLSPKQAEREFLVIAEEIGIK